MKLVVVIQVLQCNHSARLGLPGWNTESPQHLSKEGIVCLLNTCILWSCGVPWGSWEKFFLSCLNGAISFNLFETETLNPLVYSSKCLANSQKQPVAFAKLISSFLPSPILPLHLPRSCIPQVTLPIPSPYFQEMDYQSDTSLNVFYNMEAAAFLIHPILLPTCIFSSPWFPGGREISSELLASESLLNGFILQLGTSREITMISLHLLFSGK